MRKIANIIKLTVFSVILLLGFQVLVPGLSAVPRGGDRPGPAIPEDAQRFNFSDVDPYLFRHQFRTGTPNLYQFRNMTMQFNCSRDTELNITVDPRLRMRLLDLRLDVDAPLRLRINATVTPPREMPGPRDGLHRYLEIEPNATSGIRATLRLYIDHEELHEELGRYVEVQRLRWCFWNGSDWEPVNSWMDREGFLVCNTSHFSTWTIREMRNPPTMTPPEISGLSARVRAYNYTMVTPERFTWTIRERNGTAFVFKRTTMMFNCSQNLEINITATEEVRQKLFKFELQPDEPLSLQMRFGMETPPGVKAPQRWIGTFIEIEPNITAPVNARIGMSLDDIALQEILGDGIDPEELKWAWWNDTAWEEVESHVDEDNVLVAETNHFSTWTIVADSTMYEPPEPEPEPEPELEPKTNWLLYGAIAVVAVAAILLVLRRPS